MRETTDALHILTITVSLGLFAGITAVGPRATMLDALPIVAAVVGVGLHRTGRLDEDDVDDVQEETDDVDAGRPDRAETVDGASQEQVEQAVTDGGEQR